MLFRINNSLQITGTAACQIPYRYSCCSSAGSCRGNTLQKCLNAVFQIGLGWNLAALFFK